MNVIVGTWNIPDILNVLNQGIHIYWNRFIIVGYRHSKCGIEFFAYDNYGYECILHEDGGLEYAKDY